MATPKPDLSIAARTVSPQFASNQKLLLADQAVLRRVSFVIRLPEGPELSEDPTSPDRICRGADGKQYFVPEARLARRSQTSKVPDLRLERRIEGVVLTLGIELGRAGGIPDSAEMLPVDDLRLGLVGQSAPALSFQVEDIPPPEGALVRKLRAEAVLDDASLGAVMTIMQNQPGAWFKLDGTVKYARRNAAPTPTPTPTPTPVRRPIGTPIVRDHRTDTVVRDHRTRTGLGSPIVRDHRISASAGTARPFVARELVSTQIVGPGVMVGLPPPRKDLEARSSRLALSSSGTLPAHFPVSVSWNRPIYAQVSSGIGGDIESFWVTDATHGDLREAPRFNQYYVLPDAFGIALDPENGMPVFSAVLVPVNDPQASGTAAYRVRARFGLAPILDPDRAHAIRTFLRGREGLAYADLAIGGYQQAQFDADSILEALAGGATDTAPVDIDPANGFDISLDLTVEQYGLLVRQLSSATGTLRGKVRFGLEIESGNVLNRDVEVRLKLDRPAGNPLQVAIESTAEAGMPNQLSLFNPAPVRVDVGRLQVMLLAADESLPLEARPGSVAPAAVTLEPGSATTVAIGLDDGQEFAWNALGVELDDIAMALNANDVIDRAHELGGTTRVASEVRVRSFVLEAEGRLPPAMAEKLFGVDVQLRRREDETPVTVTLTLGDANKSVDMGATLADIAAGVNPAIPLFQVRRRNKLFLGDGDWSEWEEFRGQELFVTPLPV